MNSRFKNYGLWIALFALLNLFLTDSGIIIEHYQQYVDLIMYILIAVGIVINPSLGTGFKDDYVPEAIKDKVEKVEEKGEGK